MNKGMELHDSILSKILVAGNNITLSFEKAYVHKTDGVPGVDKGTGWTQSIDFIFANAFINDFPSDLPNSIDFGFMTINGKRLIDLIPIPSVIHGDIEIELTTINNMKLRINGKYFKTSELDEAQFVENFPGQ